MKGYIQVLWCYIGDVGDYIGLWGGGIWVIEV